MDNLRSLRTSIRGKIQGHELTGCRTQMLYLLGIFGNRRCHHVEQPILIQPARHYLGQVLLKTLTWIEKKFDRYKLATIQVKCGYLIFEQHIAFCQECGVVIEKRELSVENGILTLQLQLRVKSRKDEKTK